IALYKEEQARMAADLGKSSRAMILRNHGLLTLGDSVRQAFELMYYLDTACQIQIDACAGGLENVLLMTETAARNTAQQFARDGRPAEQKDWPALLRLLERRGVNYLG
ncbi:MAG TPA: class II aldolase/adducin family protein, partial [Burkholderiales bacterium]|nr:class II aldolase/adducin family protein [Burkholderiales bacterium]